MKKLKKSMKKIEDAMAAAAFAEAGEFDTARDMIKEERRVLLAIRNGRIDDRTLQYTISTSERIGAQIDILYVSLLEQLDEKLELFLAGLDDKGTPYRLIRRKGCLRKEIVDYTSSEGHILFVIIESSEHLDIDCSGKRRRLSEAWENLGCPLVVVMEGQ